MCRGGRARQVQPWQRIWGYNILLGYGEAESDVVRENGRFGPFSVQAGRSSPPEAPGEWCDTCHL